MIFLLTRYFSASVLKKCKTVKLVTIKLFLSLLEMASHLSQTNFHFKECKSQTSI